MPMLRTLAAPVRVEPERIQGSRFIAWLGPAGDEAAATAAIEAVRLAEPRATHHCWAWRLADGSERSSDDGEPSGTAGEPIRMRLQGEGLLGVVAVVTRYYGGTKLGTGGLVRAYGGAVAAALAQAEITERALTERLWVHCGYADHGAVTGELRAAGLSAAEELFDAEVHVAVDVPVEQLEQLRADLIERTSARIRFGSGD